MLCSRVLGIKQFPAWKLYSLVLGWVSGGGGVLFHSTGFDVDRLAVSMAIGFTRLIEFTWGPALWGRRGFDLMEACCWSDDGGGVELWVE